MQVSMDEFAEEEVVENPTLRAAYNLAPLHQNQPLRWDYDVHLIGEKIYDKVIHLCETCELPILVYGRMLPCKHIFCFDCARKSEKLCRRCSTKVQKVEKSALGTVFVCTYGAPKHNTNGCRRTYLSQRDLQSHIAHRHLPKATSASSKHQAPVPTVQPAPNQLPLTQQQAAQQAAQKQGPGQGPAHSPALQPHLQPSPLPGQGVISQPASSLAASTGVAPNPQTLSPAPPLIPGLGDLRPIASAGQGQVMMGQGSPHLQPAQSPNAHAQNSGLNFSSLTPTKSDIYRPLDMPQMGQQTQPAMGMGGSQLQSNQNIQGYSPQLQFPVSTAMMQQLGSQQMGSMSTQMHPAPVPHQHSNLSVPQSLDNSYNQNMSPALQTSQSRTNVNLITVPIQDEGQFRPLPYVNPSMTPQSGNNPLHSQARANIPGQSQPFSQPPISSGSFSNPSTFSQMGGQPQTMAGGISPQNLPYNQTTGMRNNNPGMMMNQRPGIGGNLHPSVSGALAGVMHAMNLVAARAQGGLMPTPGTGAQGVGNRFPQSGRWPAGVGIQPRMTQGPQRPRGDAPFNPGPYYN